MSNKIAVYFPGSKSDHYELQVLLNRITLSRELIKFDNINEFAQSNIKSKCAVFFLDHTNISRTSWIESIRDVLKYCNQVFVFCWELHDWTVETLSSIDLPGVSIYVSGYLDYDFQEAKIFHYQKWFHYTRNFYFYHPGFLDDNLTPYVEKEKYFDILLGRGKYHRNFVFEWLHRNYPTNLQDCAVVSYQSPHPLKKDIKSFIFENNNSHNNPIEEIECQTQSMNYHGWTIEPHIIVPVEIYNQTAYSLVTETNTSNNYSFFTEKIVKPILAKRLFVVISGMGYLKNLRNLGFKTFDGIIDESYDSIKNPDTRFLSALRQIKLLSSLPQTSILNQIKEITEHNYKLALETDWEKNTADQFWKEITSL